MKIQSTSAITTAQLAAGKTFDFDTSQKFCTGIAILNTSSNTVLYDDASIQVFFDTEEVLPSLTPVSLLQSSTGVAPNSRFLFIKKRNIEKKRFTVKGTIPADKSIIIMLHLENE